MQISCKKYQKKGTKEPKVYAKIMPMKGLLMPLHSGYFVYHLPDSSRAQCHVKIAKGVQDS